MTLVGYVVWLWKVNFALSVRFWQSPGILSWYQQNPKYRQEPLIQTNKHKLKSKSEILLNKKVHCTTYIYRIMTLVEWICSVALKSWFCVKWTLLTISRNLELASTKPEIWAQVFKQPISLPIEIQIHYSATMTKVLLLWLDTHIYPQWSQSLSEILFELFFAISECNLSIYFITMAKLAKPWKENMFGMKNVYANLHRIWSQCDISVKCNTVRHYAVEIFKDKKLRYGMDLHQNLFLTSPACF